MGVGAHELLLQFCKRRVNNSDLGIPVNDIELRWIEYIQRSYILLIGQSLADLQ